MKDLIILGTGVHGGEMAHIVERINRQTPTWKLLGHIAPKATAKTDFAGHPVLGSAEDLAALLAEHTEALLVSDNEFLNPRLSVPATSSRRRLTCTWSPTPCRPSGPWG